jgi:hypothetical protein
LIAGKVDAMAADSPVTGTIATMWGAEKGMIATR